MPKSTTFLGNFCRGFKFYHFSSEIILGNFYKHLAIFSGHIGSMYLLLELCGSIPMIRQKNVGTIFKSKLFVKAAIVNQKLSLQDLWSLPTASILIPLMSKLKRTIASTRWAER